MSNNLPQKSRNSQLQNSSANTSGLWAARSSALNPLYYNARITRNNPGSIIILLDQSGSMDEEYKEGKIDLDNITEDYFESHLMTKELPPVDLMIRSSGECRLSNFLLWQLSYAEFIFDEAYWPDFNAEKLHECIWKYQNRDRRYGGVKK